MVGGESCRVIMGSVRVRLCVNVCRVCPGKPWLQPGLGQLCRPRALELPRAPPTHLPLTLPLLLCSGGEAEKEKDAIMEKLSQL